jgi:ComF family protein
MKWIHTLLDVIFPPRREELLVATLDEKGIAKIFHPMNTIHGWSIAPYDDERVRALVWEAKYHRNPRALAHIGTALTRACSLHLPNATHIVPIPLSKERERSRGYNQMTEALSHSTLPLPCTLLENVLVRTRETVPQTQLARKQRLTNVVGCFSVPHNKKHLVQGAHIVVMDDVITTGATLTEARRTLLRAGAASVQVLAFARSI